jgi:hypothetical protein
MEYDACWSVICYVWRSLFLSSSRKSVVFDYSEDRDGKILWNVATNSYGVNLTKRKYAFIFTCQLKYITQRNREGAINLYCTSVHSQLAKLVIVTAFSHHSYHKIRLASLRIVQTLWRVLPVIVSRLNTSIFRKQVNRITTMLACSVLTLRRYISRSKHSIAITHETNVLCKKNMTLKR